MRIAFGVEYNGAAYSGWQRQSHASSLQSTIEAAISKVANQSIRTICAGRTDAGVHAFNQVIHFDTAAVRTERGWLMGTNANLPSDISVHWVKFVPDSFSARFSAISRTYRYIINNQSFRSALMHDRAAFIYQPLNEILMHEAAQYLLGEHDFSAFRASGCQAKTAMRCVSDISVRREGHLVIMEITANAFLYHMVRNIMGVLIEIGLGEKPVVWAEEVLHSKIRLGAGSTAPACGLYFVDVVYPVALKGDGDPFALRRGVVTPRLEG